jgi:anti-sigma factor RsiW
MACEQWRGQLDAYLDGELDSAQAGALRAHLQGCTGCAADALGRVQMKRAVQMAGNRYAPSAELRNRITKSVATKARRNSGWFGKLAVVPAVLLLIVAAAVSLYLGRENASRQRVYSELADLHVAALASATPVEVVSTDRHTVKPWFQGKIPFTFNLPELQGSEFMLLGGRVTYLAQTPGAHLIYQGASTGCLFLFSGSWRRDCEPAVGAGPRAVVQHGELDAEWAEVFCSGGCRR